MGTGKRRVLTAREDRLIFSAGGTDALKFSEGDLAHRLDADNKAKAARCAELNLKLDALENAVEGLIDTNHSLDRLVTKLKKEKKHLEQQISQLEERIRELDALTP